MKLSKLLAVTVLVILGVGCGNKSEARKDLFALNIKNQKKAYTASDVISVSVLNKKNKPIDSILYSLDSERITATIQNTESAVPLVNQKLGQRSLIAKIYSEGESYEASHGITILASVKPKLYTYKILETYPHDITAYTQGLEFENDTLYESTGTYKISSLRKTDMKSGTVLEKVALADSYFGEGLTI